MSWLEGKTWLRQLEAAILAFPHGYVRSGSMIIES